MTALSDAYLEQIESGCGHRIAVRRLAATFDLDEFTISRTLKNTNVTSVSVPPSAVGWRPILDGGDAPTNQEVDTA